jgi:DNA polymerase I-like protein with 3'-5' exonuclease and polymerase domains
MFSGVDFAEFLSWKNHPLPEFQEKFKQTRQRAKAINFGIPSGLTPQGLGQYAQSAYGVDFSVQVKIFGSL